ncbi:MAG: FHA domain-containing protein [Polyangiales bacterium]
MTSSPRKPLFLWSPRPLVERAAEQPLEQFVANMPDLFLVVRLNDFSSELLAGLEGNETLTVRGRPRRLNTISVAWSVPEQTEVSPPTSLRPSPPRGPVLKNEFDMSPELLRSECYVAGVKKRTLEHPLTMVSIGRAPERDITLQHPSVSRQHAIIDLSGELTLVDTGSRNHTFVNGEIVRGKTVLRAGDSVKFGAVRCSVCTASGLWKAVRS